MNSCMKLATAASAVLWLAQSAAFAADVVKENNLDALDLGSSWVSGTAPGTNDTALFDSTYATTGELNAAAPVQWSGLRVGTPGGSVRVNNSTSPNNVGLGAGGIDMSSAGVDLVIRRYQMDANQTWDIGSGRTFRIGSPNATFAPAANNAANNRVGVFVNNASGATITKTGEGTVYLDMGNTSLGNVNWQVNAGTLAAIWSQASAFGSGTVTLAGGGLADGTPVAGSLGNWTWNNPITLQTATTSFIDNQNTGGSGRWLKLEGALSGDGNLELRNTGVGWTSVNAGFILAGTNTMTGTLTIPASSIVRVGGSAYGSANANAGADGTLGAATVINDGWLTFSRTDFHYVSNNISGAGSIRIGSESLAGTESQFVSLSGDWTHTGNTYINRGTLYLESTASLPNTAEIWLQSPAGETATLDVTSAGGFTLNSGQKLIGRDAASSANVVTGDLTASSGTTLVPGGSNTINTLTFNNNLTLTGGGSLVMDITTANWDKITVYGNLSPSGVTTIQAANVGGLATGDYPLIEVYGATLGGDVTNFILTGLVSSGTRQSFSLAYDTNSVPQVVKLVVSGSGPANLTWMGDGSANVWDVDGALNWDNGGSPDKFFQNDAVTFVDSGSTNPAVNLVGALSPSSVTDFASVDYTFTGTGGITGAVTTVTHHGPGKLTLANTNTYEGLTTVNGGILAVTGGAALADSGSVSVAAGTFQVEASETVGTVNSVAGGVINAQSGTLSYSSGSQLGTLTGTGTVQWNAGADTAFGQFTSPDALAFNGTLVLRGSTPSLNPGSMQPGTGRFWLHSVDGSQLAGTSFDLDTGASLSNAQDVIVGDWDATSGNRLLTLRSLTGYGALRCDAGGDGLRHILVNQSTDTTYDGLVLAHASTHATPFLRGVLFEKQGGGTLTMANVMGRQTASATGATNADYVIEVKGGKLVMLATNTLNGPITVAGGATLQVGGAGMLTDVMGSGPYSPSITNDGTLTFDSAADQALSGVITGTGTLNKANGNMLTLLGANTYSGATTVSQGTLALASDHNGGGDFTVADGATLTANNSTNGTSALMGALTLGDTGTATVSFPLVTSTSLPVLNATNGLTVNGADFLIGDESTNTLAAGTVYPLIAYGTVLTGGLPSVVLPAGFTGSLTNDAVNKWIALEVTSAPAAINPNPGNLDFAVSDGSINLSWTTHAGWILQQQVNDLSMGLSNNWVDVPGSESITTTNIPVGPTLGTTFFRLRHP